MLLALLTSLLIGTIFASSYATTPVNLGIWILFTALLISMITALTVSTWFSALLFLIYIGGMLVMFTYFAAVTPNLELHLKPMMILALLMTTALYLVTLKIFSPLPPSMSTKKSPMTYSPLYESTNSVFLIFLGILLFLALIMVVKVTQRLTGPLRPFF